MDELNTINIIKHYNYNTPVDNEHIINVEYAYNGSTLISKVKAFQYSPGIWYIPEYEDRIKDPEGYFYTPRVLHSKYTLDQKLTAMTILMERIASTKQGQILLAMIARGVPVSVKNSQNLYSIQGSTIISNTGVIKPLHVLILPIQGYQHNFTTIGYQKSTTDILGLDPEKTLLNSMHSTVRISPEICLTYFNKDSIEVMDPAVALYHELVHSLHNIYNVDHKDTIEQGNRTLSCEEYMTYGGTELAKLGDYGISHLSTLKLRYNNTANILNVLLYSAEDKKTIAYKYDFILQNGRYIVDDNKFNQWKETLIFGCNESNFCAELGVSNRTEYYSKSLPFIAADITNPNIYSALHGFKKGQHLFNNDDFVLHPNTIYSTNFEKLNVYSDKVVNKGKKINSLSIREQKKQLFIDSNVDLKYVEKAIKKTESKIVFPLFDMNRIVSYRNFSPLTTSKIDALDSTSNIIEHTFTVPSTNLTKIVFNTFVKHYNYDAPVDGKNIIIVEKNIKQLNGKITKTTNKLFQIIKGVWINPDAFHGLDIDPSWKSKEYCSTSDLKSKYLRDMSIVFERIYSNPVGKFLLNLTTAGLPIPKNNQAYDHDTIILDNVGKMHLGNVQIIPNLETYYPHRVNLAETNQNNLTSSSSFISFNPDCTYLQYLPNGTQQYLDPALILFNHLLMSCYQIYGLYDSKPILPKGSNDNNTNMDISHYLAHGRNPHSPFEKYLPQYIENIKTKYLNTIDLINTTPNLREARQNFKNKYFIPSGENHKAFFDEGSFVKFIRLFTDFLSEKSFNFYNKAQGSVYEHSITIPFQIDLSQPDVYDINRGVLSIENLNPVYKKEITDEYLLHKLEEFYTCINKRDVIDIQNNEILNLYDINEIELDSHKNDNIEIKVINSKKEDIKSNSKPRIKKSCKSITEIFDNFTTLSNKFLLIKQSLHNKKTPDLDNNSIETSSYKNIKDSLVTTIIQSPEISEKSTLSSSSPIDSKLTFSNDSQYIRESLILKTQDQSIQSVFNINNNLNPKVDQITYLSLKNKNNIFIAKNSNKHILTHNNILLNFQDEIKSTKGKIGKIDDVLGFVSYTVTLLDNYYDEERHLKFNSAFSNGLHSSKDILSIVPHYSMLLFSLGVDIYDRDYQNVVMTLGIILLLYCVPEFSIVLTIYEIFNDFKQRAEEKAQRKKLIRSEIFLKLSQYNDYINQSMLESKKDLEIKFKTQFYKLINESVKIKKNELLGIKNNILHIAQKKLTANEMEELQKHVNEMMIDANSFLQDYKKNESDRWIGELKHALKEEFITFINSLNDSLVNSLDSLLESMVVSNMRYLNSVWIDRLKKEIKQSLDINNIQNKLKIQVESLTKSLDDISNNLDFEYIPYSQFVVEGAKIYDKNNNLNPICNKIIGIENLNFDYKNELLFTEKSTMIINTSLDILEKSGSISLIYKSGYVGINKLCIKILNSDVFISSHQTWMHLCVTWNEQSISFYVNGNLYKIVELQHPVANIIISGHSKSIVHVSNILIYCRWKSKGEVQELYKEAFPEIYIYDQSRAPLRFNKEYRIKNDLYKDDYLYTDYSILKRPKAGQHHESIVVKLLPVGRIKYDDLDLINLEQNARNATTEEQRKYYEDYINYVKQEKLCKNGNKKACEIIKDKKTSFTVLPNDIHDAEHGNVGAKLRLLSNSRKRAIEKNDGREFRYFDLEYRRAQLQTQMIVDKNHSVFNIKDKTTDYITSAIPICIVNTQNKALGFHEIDENILFDAMSPDTSIVRLTQSNNEFAVHILMSKHNSIVGMVNLKTTETFKYRPNTLYNLSSLPDDLADETEIIHMDSFCIDTSLINTIPNSVWLPSIPFNNKAGLDQCKDKKYDFLFISKNICK